MGAMSCCQNPLIRYQSSTTEPAVIHKESGHPRVGVRSCLGPTHNILHGSRDPTLPAMLLVPFLYPGYLS